MSEWFSKSKQPLDNVMIEVEGYDWSRFKAWGKFIPYKGKNNVKNGISQRRRFCRDTGNGFQNDHETWLDAKRWKYKETKEG